MKLSIIIPVYNEEKYLRRCLDSVAAQMCDDVEVLVIDDGSEDGSYEIAKSFEQFTTIKKTMSSFGVSFARNIGLNAAQGEYITFLDSDDEYYPGAIKNMLDEIKAHEGENLIQFDHSRTHCYNCPGYYDVESLPRKWVLVWNKVYRRDFLYKYGITFPYGLQFEEDRIFNLRVFNHCSRFYHSSMRTVIKHFDNESSLCHTVEPEKIFELNEALVKILRFEHSTPHVKNIARQCIADLYESKNARRLFGKEGS